MSKQSLRRSLSRWNISPVYSSSPEPFLTKRATETASRILGGDPSRKPADYDLRGLYYRITRAWQQYHASSESVRHEKNHFDWISFYEQWATSLNVPASRDLRRIPWILFYEPTVNTSPSERSVTRHYLGADKIFLKYYCQWLSEQGSTASIRTLMQEFLFAYPIKLSTFDYVRNFLQNRIVNHKESTVSSLRKWQKRCHDFDILEENGHALGVEKLLRHPGSIQDTLDQSGLTGRLSQSNFLESGVLETLPKISSKLQRDAIRPSLLKRMIQLLEYEDGLRFDKRTMRLAIAEALLEPFAKGIVSPVARESLESFFIHHYGDPRLPSGKANWAGIGDRYRQVVTMWLAQHALNEFFRLIKETALDRHWSYRKAFWQAYMNNNTIFDAWFVLGRSAEKMIESISEEQEYSYGLLQGAEKTQSVLLLRMHGATVAEWTHNGSCRIWLDGNQDTPQLHREHTPYRGSELRVGADFVQAHYGSEYGSWQRQVAFWLEDYIGVEVSQYEYL